MDKPAFGATSERILGFQVTPCFFASREHTPFIAVRAPATALEQVLDVEDHDGARLRMHPSTLHEFGQGSVNRLPG